MELSSSEGGPLGGAYELALRDRHAALCARFVEFAGWEMPLQYSGIVAEHLAVRERVGLFDVSHLGRVELRGAEAGELLRSVTTYDVTAMPPGSAHYSLCCNDEGGIEDDIMVYRLVEDRWLVVHNAANAEAGLERLESAAPHLARDINGETVMLAVQGPKALALGGAFFGKVVAGLARHDCVSLTWQGDELLITRTGYTGEDGIELVAPRELAGRLWQGLIQVGLLPVGIGARDTLRLEAALPLHGSDIGPSTNPFEARLGWAVTLEDERPFKGREALAALAVAPPDRRLTCVESEARAVFRRGQTVIDAPGATVGSLTSGAFSPTLGLGIGMAYLPPNLATPGLNVSVVIRDRAVPARVIRRPFYKPDSAT